MRAFERAVTPAERWTDEKVEALKVMWTKGLSAAQIANRLGGVSRSAVLGKVHRLNLPDRGPDAARINMLAGAKRGAATKKALGIRSGPKPKEATGSSAAMSKAARKARLKVFGNGMVQEEAPPRPVVTPSTYVETLTPTATIMDLQFHQCRWPIGAPDEEGFGFCGRRKSLGAYCATHARVGYQPAKPQKPRQADVTARARRRVAY